MNKPKYILQAQAEVISSMGEFQIDWHKIAEQVADAKLLVENTTKEPEMKKKNGKKKKGY